MSRRSPLHHARGSRIESMWYRQGIIASHQCASGSCYPSPVQADSSSRRGHSHLVANKMRLTITPEEYATHAVHALVTGADVVSSVDLRNSADDQSAHLVLVHNLAVDQTFDSIVFRQETSTRDSRILDTVRDPAGLLARRCVWAAEPRALLRLAIVILLTQDNRGRTRPEWDTQFIRLRVGSGKKVCCVGDYGGFDHVGCGARRRVGRIDAQRAAPRVYTDDDARVQQRFQKLTLAHFLHCDFVVLAGGLGSSEVSEISEVAGLA
ncbi:hypothetical protein BU25DRAFT_262257 [Macroventuria anomochaeta]|uniref:Uncharacterized protein n=1 Tax=Macroventuria anomochaeta TaxID=301207 RepID=A0ACB6S6Z8_9PLEO|nr:uncharacterized protein BU25DRAFT_262257 [Macroventuria anomochaeta]KAF2629971.1 hypothetical protein BU25DRAFT_262257 [Macroventuria anomochaeta]